VFLAVALTLVVIYSLSFDVGMLELRVCYVCYLLYILSIFVDYACCVLSSVCLSVQWLNSAGTGLQTQTQVAECRS